MSAGLQTHTSWALKFCTVLLVQVLSSSEVVTVVPPGVKQPQVSWQSLLTGCIVQSLQLPEYEPSGKLQSAIQHNTEVLSCTRKTFHTGRILKMNTRRVGTEERNR